MTSVAERPVPASASRRKSRGRRDWCRLAHRASSVNNTNVLNLYTCRGRVALRRELLPADASAAIATGRRLAVVRDRRVVALADTLAAVLPHVTGRPLGVTPGLTTFETDALRRAAEVQS